jgi:hypothetical protein
MTWPCSIHWTNSTAPREGSSIAWLIRYQMLLFSSQLIVCKMPVQWISSPASLARIRQSRKWTRRKPPAWFFNIFICRVQALTPSRHWVWVSSLGFGMPAFNSLFDDIAALYRPSYASCQCLVCAPPKMQHTDWFAEG